jgi:hypothetical protein
MKRLGFLLLLAAAAPANSAETAPAVVLPNADGVLDLAGAIQAQAFDAIPNPFRNRYHPALQIQELPLAITVVLVGPPPAVPSARINGELYCLGDKFEGLTIAAITADTLELRQDDIRVCVPVQDLTPKLRLLR